MFRDIKYVDLCINELKDIDDKIRKYFEHNIEPKLKYMTKSYLQNTFTCRNPACKNIKFILQNTIKEEIVWRYIWRK